MLRAILVICLGKKGKKKGKKKRKKKKKKKEVKLHTPKRKSTFLCAHSGLARTVPLGVTMFPILYTLFSRNLVRVYWYDLTAKQSERQPFAVPVVCSQDPGSWLIRATTFRHPLQCLYLSASHQFCPCRTKGFPTAEQDGHSFMTQPGC